MALEVSDLQSWAKCSGCSTVMWCEVSDSRQRCACACGALSLDDDVVIGESSDLTFTAEAMQSVLDAEYP